MAPYILKSNSKLIILFTVLCSLFCVSCTKKLYTVGTQENSYYGKERYENKPLASDSRELKSFLAKGSGKYLNTRNVTAEDIIKTARKYLGVPHCMGGSSKRCTDCSGLIMAVFAEHNILLPHSSEEIARYGKIIRDKSELRKGDLVFFIKSYKTSKYITHVGIYLGNNEFIHTSSKKGVTVSSLDNSYWKDKFIFGTQVLM
jgi:cell wall-associated NlpC family hydrolase